jgi:hypothetical protein
MTNSRPRRPLLSALALALVAVIAAGCSSGASSAPTGARPTRQIDPLAMVAAASDKIDSAGAVAFDFRTTISAGGQRISGSGSAVAAADGSRTHMTMSYDSFPGMPGGFHMELFLVDGVMYMSTSTFAALGANTDALGGKDWVSMDLNDVVPGFESLAKLGSGQNDPSQAFEYLKGASDVQLVGAEDVGGESTQHFRGTLDLEKAASQLPADAREAVRATMDQFQSQFGSTSMPFDVWVDDQGRIRRMTYALTSNPDAAQALSMSITVDITDYDADLDFDVPSRDEAVDLNDLLGAR